MMTFRKISWPTTEFGNPDDVWNPRMFGPSDVEPDEILHGYMYSWCIKENLDIVSALAETCFRKLQHFKSI